MDVAVFSTGPYDREFLGAANAGRHQFTWIEESLGPVTACLAARYPAVCAFVNDHLDSETMDVLRSGATRVIVLRCAGFNNVDIDAARRSGMAVARVPAYSPHAVAEHAVGLMLALDRHLVRACSRVREGNFSLKGLLGFDLHGRTVGIVGTGRIGACLAKILNGFGCRLLATDPVRNADCEKLGVQYVPFTELLARSDIISLHCPLTPETHHLVDADAMARMNDGVMLINTGRGALIETRAVLDGLKSRRIGYLGLDVYEQEEALFFRDLSDTVIQDDVFVRLLTFPNVIVTGHLGFFTRDALTRIAETTIHNLDCFEARTICENYLVAPPL